MLRLSGAVALAVSVWLSFRPLRQQRDNHQQPGLNSNKALLNIGLDDMIHKARDLSPDQKMAIESLLGRAVAEDEAISIRTVAPVSAPVWLQKSWESAKRQNLDRLSTEEIDAEIDAARKARRNRQQSVRQ